MTLSAQVEVRFDGFHEEVALDVSDGEVVAVLGPNGAGKTTLLRALAGVRPLTGGRIVLDDLVLDDPDRGILVPPEQRSCGLVFQEHLLFPHLDALANVAFGPRRRGASKSEAAAVSREWLERLDVADVAHQRPQPVRWTVAAGGVGPGPGHRTPPPPPRRAHGRAGRDPTVHGAPTAP